jgi:hypothetical protein
LGEHQAENSFDSIRRMMHHIPQKACSFVVSPRTIAPAAISHMLGASVAISSITRATGYLGAATAAVELVLGLMSVRGGLSPLISMVEHFEDGSMAVVDRTRSAMEVPDPTGIFLSRAWTGQTAAILAHACSVKGNGLSASAS